MPDIVQKETIIEKFRTHDGDTGSSEVQIAILTDRISQLTTHMRIHKHDYHTQRGLLKLVGQRRQLQRYLKKKDPKSYQAIIKKLKIRE